MIDQLTVRRCPFCGSERLENLAAAVTSSGPVCCIDCGARGPVRFGPAYIATPLGTLSAASNNVEAWNVRNAAGVMHVWRKPKK